MMLPLTPMSSPATPSQLQVPNTYLRDDFMNGKSLLGPVCEPGPANENELFVSSWSEVQGLSGRQRKEEQPEWLHQGERGGSNTKQGDLAAGRAPGYQACGFGFHSKGPGKPLEALLRHDTRLCLSPWQGITKVCVGAGWGRDETGVILTLSSYTQICPHTVTHIFSGGCGGSDFFQDVFRPCNYQAIDITVLSLLLFFLMF